MNLFLIPALLTALLGGAASGFSVEKEISLGDEIAREVEKQMPLSTNEQWQQEIASLGSRLVPFVNRPEIPYKFRVLDAKDQINAFALPGGYVYFTERMWRIMTPDERAAIMAHEIVHCDQRHGVDSAIRSQQRALWTLPLVILSGGAAASYLVTLGNAVVEQRYSRKMEREADELGIRLCKKAGFDPAGAVTSMLKLLHIESDQNHYEVSEIFASHPDTQKRIDYLTTAALELGARPEDLALKAVDDPARVGNVTRKSPDIRLIHASASRSLEFGEKVDIRKMLWDETAQALAPKTVAVATVLIPGTFPALVIENDDQQTFSDVMVGDGVYPASAAPGE